MGRYVSHCCPWSVLSMHASVPKRSCSCVLCGNYTHMSKHVSVEPHLPLMQYYSVHTQSKSSQYLNMHLFLTGNKIARRLSEQGCKVAAWNRDGSKTAALSEAGIAVHHSAADAIAASDILVLMLSDADAIQDVLLSAQQPVDLQNKVVLQMGTIGKSLSEQKQ